MDIALQVYEVFKKKEIKENKITMDFNEISRDPLGPYVKGGSDYTLGKEKKLLKINKEDIEKEK